MWHKGDKLVSAPVMLKRLAILYQEAVSMIKELAKFCYSSFPSTGPNLSVQRLM